MTRLLFAAALGVLAGCGAKVQAPGGHAAAADCTSPHTATPLTLDIDTQYVTVRGNVNGNVKTVLLQSERTGARHEGGVQTDGTFSLEVAPGDYILLVQEFGAPVRVEPVTVPGDTNELTLNPCAKVDCSLPKEPQFSYDPDRPQGAVVTGQFSAASGVPYLGNVEFLAADPATQAGYGGTLVDEQLAFTFDSVPPGQYHVVYESRLGVIDNEPALEQKQLPFPFGRWIDDSVLNVELPAVTWEGVIPTVPVQVEVRVNGGPMPDNQMGDASRGFLTLGDEEGAIIDALPLGATGPAAYDLQVIPGEYTIGLLTYGAVGHGELRALVQDVLPTGVTVLGPLTVAPDAQVPQEVTFDVGVTPVIFPPSALPDSHLSVYLEGGPGSFTWLDIPTQATRPSLAYVGCYAVTTDVTDYPTYRYGVYGVDYGLAGEACVSCE